LSAYAAKAGMKCSVFIPKEIDLGKLHQLIAYGAEILLTESVEQAALESMKLRGSYGVGPQDPYFVEGEKTIGFEICDQLGWLTPRFLVVPLGSGGNLHAIWKGLKEFSKVGLITSIQTSMIGVQASVCAPIAEAFKQKENPTEGRTIATEIAIANPQFKRSVLKALLESNGLATAVSDGKILESIHLLAKCEGIFAEPSAAATIAGLRELISDGKIDRTDEVVCVITGAGLKDPNIAAKLVGEKQRIGSLVSSAEKKFITRLGPTKMQILETLSVRSLHGYAIWKELKSSHGKEIKIPVVYQHLRELEEISLIGKTPSRGQTSGREKVYYSLSEKGRKFVKLWERSTF
jgi:threonine synthase